MNLPLAGNPFDNPWVFAAVLVLGALANWLSKRQRDRQAGEPSEEADSPPPAASRPPAEINLEETLRRLLGGELQAPIPPPAPPVMADPSRSVPPPLPGGLEEEPRQAAWQTLLVPRPPPPALPPPVNLPDFPAASEVVRATNRFESKGEQGRPSATVVDHLRGHRACKDERTATRWRNPGSARQALVASIVFAPPKSLEP